MIKTTYGGGAGRERTGGLSKSSRAGRVPESHGSAAEVDVVRKVVPNIRDPVDVPFRLTANKPSQVVVRGGAGISVDPSVFHLSKVRLAEQNVSRCQSQYPARMKGNRQEVNLMLIGRIWRVCARLLHAKMIVQTSSSEVDLRLGNQFSPPHIGVPESCGVDCDLDTLVGSCIGRVLI